ncbi:site-specific DNA-methyltransferase (adenine-specific) [Microbacterium sp. BE35]|uniref:site-specific DNA-methyltransferase n=1 Tax=Microbacterium sp. BE35 TaxID=2817773 RepID=UPI00285547E4|nr:site-specific DNA-methyltransferase [Microbacterium sp. BE35]MDR7189747.1 site-specific DNA-methyltransferase (adenine-specific) [Microbacterium sp. BE35]
MSLYYEDEFVELHLGDCRAIRGWTRADVLVTDPPYGTQFTGGNPKGGYGRRQNAAGNSRHASTRKNIGVEGFTIANDDSTEVRDAILELWGDKPALVFGSPRLPDPPMKVADRLVWDKKRPGMNGGPWRYRHESIYVTEGFVRTNDAAVSILTAFPEQDDHIHGKPLALMEALVGAAPAGLLADPFAGSGTTLVAARNLGRKIIGVEVEERYCEVIVRRLSQQAFDFSGLEAS